jgi:hypothetical protein
MGWVNLGVSCANAVPLGGSFALLIAIPLWGGRPARPDGQDARPTQ